LERQSTGTIEIGGRVVNDIPPKDRDIAMVFQSYALYPSMTVRQNITFGMECRHVPRAEQEKALANVARLLQIEPLLGRKPSQLSGGQRQRVAMGRALVRDPLLFLFDEPLSNLDASLRVQMRVELKKIHDRLGTTAIYVTHDQVEAMTLGDRVVVMKDGVVQQMGEPLELYNAPANRFVAGFIGSPGMNFATVRLGEAAGALWAENEAIRIKVPSQIATRLCGHRNEWVVLGIRPKDLRVASSSDDTDLSFEVEIEVVEKLGSEILLDVRAGASAMVAAVENTIRANVHDRVRLTVDVNRLHFFDQRSGAAI